MSQRLYTTHNRALSLLYADLESFALLQDEVFVGTAGSIVTRQNASGFRFYAHQTYDGDGKKRERYLGGPVGDPEVESKAAALRERILESKSNVPSLRMLVREGFAAADRKTYATLASLHNHGVFKAGGMLIGSHAFGAMLNKLGARATQYATQDIDIGRREKLAFNEVPGASFLEMLRDSGIPFVEVPELDRKSPSTSFKQEGKSHFHVDLLVPSHDESFPVVPVPELRAHATGLPYLEYLLAEWQYGMIIAREGCCGVRLPLPERFAVHKLIVSQIRTGRDAKSSKDIHQAATLCAVMADIFPGSIESALESVPVGARKRLDRALEVVERILSQSHPRAWRELQSQ